MTNRFTTPLLTAFVLTATLFTACEPQQSEPTTGAAATAADNVSTTGAGLNIVFIRLDSLQTGYTALSSELNRLEENTMAAQENIQKEVAALERDARSLQNKMQQGLMAPNKMQAEQQRLARKEQEIMQKRDMALGSIQQDQMELQARFGEKVKVILEELKADQGYDLIFNEGGGSGLLMGSDALDVTPLVLERLNALPAETLEEEATEEDK